MANFFDAIFGEGCRTVNRDAEGWIITDEHGQHVESSRAEALTLSGEDSIDRARISTFYHCGCSTLLPIGGRCAESGCRNVSCQRCFGRCSGPSCQKPLCLEHSSHLAAEGRIVRLCRECYGPKRRRQLGLRTLRALVTPISKLHELQW